MTAAARSPIASPNELGALLSHAREGDPQALHELLVRVQPDIRRFATRSCYVTADIEDAIQESLWIIARHVQSLKSATSFTAWLMTVVMRECRRLAQRVSALTTGGKAQPLDDRADEQRLATMPEHDLRLDLAAAIASLPPQYREVVIARDLRELTIDEIASEYALTREAAKARLHRGRVLLREYLRDA
jgi:RNA polymerase sigma-70 factor (ECF subfamily)